MPRKARFSNDTENDVFAVRLRQAMETRGETQASLADKISSQFFPITRQAVSLYATGQSRPDTERLAALAKVLDVSADYLLGLSDVMRVNADLRAACDYTRLTEETVKRLHIQTFADPLSASFFQRYLEDTVIYDSGALYIASEYIETAAVAGAININETPTSKQRIDILAENMVRSINGEAQGNFILFAADAEKYFLSAAQNILKKRIDLIIEEMEGELKATLINSDTGKPTKEKVAWKLYGEDEKGDSNGQQQTENH